MKSPRDPAGNALIDPESYDFSLADICILTQLPTQTIRNWMHRELVTQIGRKDAVTGHLRFSLICALKLLTMQRLARMDLSLTDAGAIALNVAKIAREVLREPRTGHRPLANLLIGWNESGDLVAGYYATTEKHLGRHYPPAGDGEGGYEPLRNPYVCVPIWSMVADLLLRTRAVAAAAEREESPVHV